MRLSVLIGCLLTITSVGLVTIRPSRSQTTSASPQLSSPAESDRAQSTPKTTSGLSRSLQPVGGQQSRPTALLTASTIITVAPQQAGMLQVKKGEGKPINLVLAQPITDHAGKVVVFAGTPVMGKLKTTKGGQKLLLKIWSLITA